MWVIKDLKEDTYFLRRFSPATWHGKTSGWYGKTVGHARLYDTEKAANKIIAGQDHHVWFPGERTLKAVPVLIKEQ